MSPVDIYRTCLEVPYLGSLEFFYYNFQDFVDVLVVLLVIFPCFSRVCDDGNDACFVDGPDRFHIYVECNLQTIVSHDSLHRV